MGDAARSLRPNLVGRGAVMRLPVGRIAVLVGIKVLLRRGGHDLVNLANRAVGPFIAWSDDQLGPVGPKDALALERSAVRKAELHGITHRRANHGVGDPGVAAGRVNDDLAGT